MRIIRFSCLCLLLAAQSLYAQPSWKPLFGSFLEPNRFTTSYDADATRLRLEVGFGAEALTLRSIKLGVECFVWSGLKTLGGFRFPVETADYFFGLNAVIPEFMSNPNLTSRFRISHISSHLVDGTLDSVVGGSSSRFSREFISFETEYLPHEDEIPLRVSAGVKYVFHQVTTVEPEIQFPFTAEYGLFRWTSHQIENPFSTGELFASVSTAGGPQYPVFTGSLVVRLQPTANTAIDTYGQYFTGETKYGVEGEKTRSGIEVGVRFSTLYN